MLDDARLLLMYLVLPLWIAARFLAWCCHRHTAIECTTGWRKSAFHLLMFVQMGIAGLMALLLEITTSVLASIGMLFVLHEITVWVELRFVVGRRSVGPFEQMVHSVMEILPLAALLLLAVAHAGPLDDGLPLAATLILVLAAFRLSSHGLAAEWTEQQFVARGPCGVPTEQY